jgi:uncharacterized protein YndB with AHSA1/START domain
VVEREVELGATPDDVWSALTEPARLEEWLGGDVDVDVRPGGTGTLVDPDGRRHAVLVEDVVPGHRLGLWWWPDDGGDGDEPASAVSFELEPLDAGRRTLLRIVERPALAPATVPGAWAMAAALV